MKGMYDHPKEVRAARGLKIAAQNLESAVAGTQLLVLGKGDDVDTLKEEVMEDMHDIFSSVDRSGAHHAAHCGLSRVGECRVCQVLTMFSPC